MAGFYRKFGRGNRTSKHAAQHAGQARGSRRKRRLQALNAAALEAEAARLGITVTALRQKRQIEVDEIIASVERNRVRYTPPPSPVYRSSYSFY